MSARAVSSDEARGRISARVSLSAQEILQEAADLIGATVNQFVVQSALQAAERVIERERTFRLNVVESRRLFAVLDNPAQPNEALAKAMQRFERESKYEGNNRVIDI